MNDEEHPPEEVESTVSAEGSAEDPGRKIGRYRLLETLGEGGMGVVYLAEQREPVRRRVALKVIKRGLDTAQVVARFEAERQALAIMDHPNIAKVFDAGETEDGRPYFVMEYVKGIPITEYCDRERLGVRERLELFREVCEGVQHAHQKAVIHRDLKPSNVLVVLQGEKAVPKIIDFGLAKAIEHRLTERTLFTELGQIVGTPEYMSPEQAEMTAQDVDTRTDVYSLGVMLYELLAGALPFDAKELRAAGYEEIRRRIREEEPVRPSTRVTRLDAESRERVAKRGSSPEVLARQLRGDLDWIVMRSLEKDRRRRYQTAAELGAEIGRHLRDEPVEAGPPSVRYRMGKFARRNRVWVAAGAVVVLGLAAGLAVSTIGFVEARRQRDRAREATERAQEQAFRANLAAAAAASSTNEMSALRRHLDAVPPRFRSWEWRYLDAASDNSVGVVRVAGVNCVSVSPDGRVLAAGTGNGAVHLLDAGSLEELAVLERPAEPIKGSRLISEVAFSPDGTRLAAASWDSTVHIWDVDGRRELGVLRGHTNGVLSVAYNPDGTRLASSGDDEAIRFWDTATGRQLSVLEGHGDRVFSVAFDPDGTRLASGSQVKNSVRLWDTATGRQLGRVPGAIGAVFSVRFSPDGRLLAGALLDKTVRIWDAATLQEKAVLRGHTDEVDAVAWSPDGKLLASASDDRTLRLWDARDHVERAVLRGHTGFVSDVAFTPDGRHLVSASWDGTLRVWDVDSALELETLRGDQNCEYESLVFGPSGDRLALMVGSWGSPTMNQGEIWDVATGQRLAILRGHEDWGNAIAISPDGARLATAGTGRMIRLWDPETGECRHILRVPEEGVRRLAAHPGGELLASGSFDGTIRLWDWDSGEERMVLRGHRGSIQSLAFNPEGTALVSASDDSTVRVWDVSTGRERAALVVPGCAYCVAFSPDGSRLVWAALPPADPAIHIWDALLTREESVLRGHESFVYAAAFSGDGARMATAGADNTVRIWDPDSGEDLLDLRGHDHWVSAVAFRPDGEMLASASHDGTVRLWSTESMRVRARKRREILDAAPAAETVLDSLWTQPQDLSWIARRLREDHSLDEPVRHAARNLLLRRSMRIQDHLDSLYARLVFTDDVVAALEADPALGSVWRDKAIRSARTRDDEAVRLERDSWHLVRSPDRTADEYAIGLRGARAALALAPDDLDCLNTLGMALYRMGYDEEAVRTLARSDSLRAEQGYPGGMRGLAVLAMAQARRGRLDDARKTYDRVREILADPDLNWLLEEKDPALVQECERVLRKASVLPRS